jgi:hypothetical protein
MALVRSNLHLDHYHASSLTMGNGPIKLVCNETLNGVTFLAVITTAKGQCQYGKAIAGVGDPYWIWPTVPAGTVIAADCTDAPVVDNDPIVNNQRIAAVTATTEDVLTYAPAE